MCTIYDRVETTLRELKFPPLQGGPTKDDIIGLLEAVLDNYDEPEESEQVQELRQDIDDLYDGINQAIDELEDLEDIRTVCRCEDCGHRWHPKGMSFSIDEI